MAAPRAHTGSAFDETLKVFFLVTGNNSRDGKKENKKSIRFVFSVKFGGICGVSY